MALIWLIIVLLLPNKLHSQSFDNTIFDFTTFNGREADLIYQGDAHIPRRSPTGSVVPSDQTFTRLTRHRPVEQSAGRVLYSPPIRLWDGAGRRQAYFQTVIRGYIGNPGFEIIADGISFFIAGAANTSIPPGSTGGHMGLYDVTGFSPVPLVAVELDIYSNSWDPSYRHVGLNLNSRQSVRVASWDFGGSAREVEARITYDGSHNLISVFANASSSQSPVRPEVVGRVEATLDLKNHLPEWVQIGISAATGNVNAYHDIHSWSFISFMVSDDITQVVDQDTRIPQE